MYPPVLLAAATWWETFNQNFSNLEATGKNGAKAAGVVIVLIALIMGRMLVKVLGAVLLVGVALYAIFNMSKIEDKTTNTIEGEESMAEVPAPLTFTVGDIAVRPA